MLAKPDMWESEEFRRKFSKIPKSLQGQFLKAIQELYRQESETMLDFIRMSRQSLRTAGIEIRDEQGALQMTSKKLSDERQKRQAKRGTPLKKHKPNSVSPQPMSMKDHRKDNSARSATRNSENDEAGDITEDDEQYFRQETEEILRATSRADTVHATERARQLEKVEQLKQQKRANKEADRGKAQQLIREASALEQQRTEAKKRQEDAVKEKLEKRRRQKSELTKLSVGGTDGDTLPEVDVNKDQIHTPRTRSPAVISVESTPDEMGMLSSAPAPPSNDPAEEETKKSQKKKDKKKSKKKKKESEALPSDSPV